MNQERIINMKALFKNTCRKWRVMLFGGLILAVLLGGYKFYKSYSSGKKTVAENTGSSSEQSSEKKQGYSSEEEIKMAHKSLEQKNIYLQNSLVAKIDPSNEAKATAVLTVTFPGTDTQEENTQTITSENEDEKQLTENDNEDDNSDSDDNSNEMVSLTPSEQKANNILNYYISLLEKKTDWKEIANDFDSQAAYVEELVFLDKTDKKQASIELGVKYADEAGAKKILDYALDSLKKSQSDVQTKYGDHTLFVTDESVNRVVDSTLFNWMNNRLNEINNLNTSLETFTANNKASGVSTNVSMPSTKSMLKGSLKYALIGFVGGIILVWVIYALYLVTSHKVLSGREFNRQYGFTKLGCIPARDLSELKGIDGYVENIDRTYYSSDVPTGGYSVTRENLLNIADDSKSITFVSDLAEDKVKQIVNEIFGDVNETDTKLIILSNPDKNPNGLEKLKESSQIVMIAGTLETTYPRMNELVESVHSYKKNLLGSIVVG